MPLQPHPAGADFGSFNLASSAPTFVREPVIPEPVQQEPRRALAYSQISSQLYAGYALGAGGEQICGYGPVSVADFGLLHGGPDPDAEALVALGAAVWHARVLGGAGVLVATPGAPAAVRPCVPLEPLHGGLVVGEHVEHLQHGQVPVFARGRALFCLCGLSVHAGVVRS